MNYISRLVLDLLEKNVESRDDMMLTVRYVHDFEMAMLNVKKSEYYDSLFDGKLSSIKTIDRIWRKIQEAYPNLRGKEWEYRQYQAGIISSICSANQLDLFD
jgi:hypothetical protein